jgi:hypothetical protein
LYNTPQPIIDMYIVVCEDPVTKGGEYKIPNFDCLYTADVTGQQRMLFSPWHLILPLLCKGSVLPYARLSTWHLILPLLCKGSMLPNARLSTCFVRGPCCPMLDFLLAL